MKFQIQILGLLAALPCILSAPAAAPEANVARAPEGDDTLYEPLDYVYIMSMKAKHRMSSASKDILLARRVKRGGEIGARLGELQCMNIETKNFAMVFFRDF
ncbi:uncharacterized protein PAC_06227 [Phialocephala subalpina]|uniref:Uncharacterized protein n=1 Tax=Phialocephala subalpina TaxID=576137 RepID=A0A1L7WUB3_9HELO|nr:uncharacterized protein PAC_06227 [Phialocephala subalpina]